MKTAKFSVLGLLAMMVGVIVTLSCDSEEDKLTHNQIVGAADLKANASELKHTVVTPHLEQKIEPGTNVLWCNTFQLAWNELCDLAGGPIAMDSPPPDVAILNKRTASKEASLNFRWTRLGSSGGDFFSAAMPA